MIWQAINAAQYIDRISVEKHDYPKAVSSEGKINSLPKEAILTPRTGLDLAVKDRPYTSDLKRVQEERK
jgi:hypothetical protein